MAGPRVLITGAGGGNANNLIRCIRSGKFKDLALVGSDLSPENLIRSTLDENYLLPACETDEYEGRLLELIQKKNIDLIVPTNDRELGKISSLVSKLPCKTFLPSANAIELAHDKFKFCNTLADNGFPVAKSFELSHLDEIDKIVSQLPGDKYWVRAKRGTGSVGATWVTSAAQARSWIQLWRDMKNYSVSDFTISEFLPGRDMAFQSVWKDGEMILCKLVERKVYFWSQRFISGMSSTPALAVTLRDDKVIEMLKSVTRFMMDKPHGMFNYDLKQSLDGADCVTECNLGRFCMITPIFDFTGKYKTSEYYLRAAFDEDIDLKNEIDIEENVVLSRELDMLPTIVRSDEFEKFIAKATF